MTGAEVRVFRYPFSSLAPSLMGLFCVLVLSAALLPWLFTRSYEIRDGLILLVLALTLFQSLRSLEFHSRCFELHQDFLVQKRLLGARRIKLDNETIRSESGGFPRTLITMRRGPMIIGFSSRLENFPELYARLERSVPLPDQPRIRERLHLNLRGIYYPLMTAASAPVIILLWSFPALFVYFAARWLYALTTGSNDASWTELVYIIEMLEYSIIFLGPAAVAFSTYILELFRAPLYWHFDPELIAYRRNRRNLQSYPLDMLREIRLQGPPAGLRAVVIDFRPHGSYEIGAFRAACFGTTLECLLRDLKVIYPARFFAQ